MQSLHLITPEQNDIFMMGEPVDQTRDFLQLISSNLRMTRYSRISSPDIKQRHTRHK